MKKILLVTDIFPPDIGGPATFIPALATELTRSGYAVTVFCRADDPEAHAADPWPFRVVRMSRQPGLATKLKLMGTLIRETALHNQIFTNGLEQPTEWACQITRRLFALKVVGDVAWERARNRGTTSLSIDEFQKLSPAPAPISHWIAARTSFARRARLVITPSDYLRRMVIGWGVPSRQVFTIRNGVRLDAYESFVPQHRSKGPLELLYIGRLVNWKGVEPLLKAIAPLANIRLSIVGEGPEENSLRQLTESLGLNQVVEFCGALTSSEVRQRLPRAHSLILPSEYEGLSHTLIEACAAGVPCIASDRGGNPEVIEDGQSGLLVPYGEVAPLRSAIQRLADHEEFRFALATAAKARSQQFDFRTTVADTTKLLLA